jgi:hypothetical protein
VALSPQNNEAFMREVDDAVREDALRDFMARFGKPLLAAVFLGLAGLAGWLWWQSAQANDAGALGAQFSGALDRLDGGRPKAAATAAEPLAKGDNASYRAAALMLQGTTAAAEGNNRLAATRFGAVANDTANPRELRDVALLRQTLVEFDTLPPETVVARLRSIVANPENGVFPSAAELTALAEMRRNNNRRAGELFRQIARNPQTPEPLKARAVQMAGMLGFDAVETPDAPDRGAAAQRSSSREPATKE